MATRIQTKANDALSASTIDAVMDSNVTAGTRLVVLAKLNADFTPNASQITDTRGDNTWSLDWSAATQTAGTDALGDYAVFSTVVQSSGPMTVTFNPAVTGRIGVVVREYSGLGAHDGSTRNITYFTTSTTPSSGNVTPSAANGVLFGFLSSSQTQTWEAEYGDATVDTNGGRFHTAVDETVTAAAQAADSTQSSTTWDCGVIWYPDAAAASPGLPPPHIFRRGKRFDRRRRPA